MRSHHSSSSKQKEETALIVKPMPVQSLSSIELLHAQLVSFLQKPEVNGDPAYSSLMQMKKDLNNIIKKSTYESRFENLQILKDLSTSIRAKLIKLLQNNYFSSIKINGISFADLLHDIALLVAHLNPINLTDAFSLVEIDSSNRVVTSDGHQFDVAALFKFIQLTPINLLANPFTRVKFSERDKQVIINSVNQYAKRENLRVTICIQNSQPHQDPDLAATLALVRELQLETTTANNIQLTQEEYSNRVTEHLLREMAFARQWMLAHVSPSHSASVPRRPSGLVKRPLSELRNAFRSRPQTFFPTFTRHQQAVLHYLVNELFPPVHAGEAVREIGNLNDDQLAVLLELYSVGLRGQHLRSWQSPHYTHSFTKNHGDVIKHLITMQRHTPAQAIAVINGKTTDEVADMLLLLSPMQRLSQ